MINKIYLDLDGVLCDFEKGVIDATGKPWKDYAKKSEAWRALYKAGDFYAKLEWTVDGKELWEYCKNYNVEILTGIPMGNWAQKQKRNWCYRYLNDTVCVNTVFASEKQNFATPDSLLIDDNARNIEQFITKGGQGILHVSTATTIQELKRLGL